MRAARRDPLAAMALLPANQSVSRPRFGIPFVVAQDFAAAHEVLVVDADSYRKPWFVRQVIEDGLGENLFTLDGHEWLARRRPCSPVFGVGQLDGLAAMMLGTVDEVIDDWSPGEIDGQAAMTDLTMRVALRGLLGTDEDTAELAAVVRGEFDEVLSWISYRFNRPASPPAFVPTPRNRRLAASRHALRVAIGRLVRHRRTSDRGSVDVLSQLLRAQREHPELTDAAIVDECIGFMFAGHETTASTLTWVLYELSCNPTLQDDIAAEAAALEGPARAAGAAGLIDAVETMTRTRAVTEETLRMYPAGISIVRSAKRSTAIGVERILRGTLVMIPVYAIQRSPDVWEKPDSFDPDRPIVGNGAGFLPFGLGPRRCLGARFARTELHIALARVCARWKLSYARVSPPSPVVAPSLRVDGSLPLTIARRSGTNLT